MVNSSFFYWKCSWLFQLVCRYSIKFFGHKEYKYSKTGFKNPTDRRKPVGDLQARPMIWTRGDRETNPASGQNRTTNQDHPILSQTHWPLSHVTPLPPSELAFHRRKSSFYWWHLTFASQYLATLQGWSKWCVLNRTVQWLVRFSRWSPFVLRILESYNKKW